LCWVDIAGLSIPSYFPNSGFGSITNKEVFAFAFFPAIKNRFIL